jgi:TRAP transporter TAXI family solute receptor
MTTIRRVIGLTILFVFIFSPTVWAEEKRLIKIATIGVPYMRVMVTKWADVINKAIPEVNATVTSVNVPVAPRVVNSGDIDIAYTNSMVAYQAFRGKKPFFENESLKKIRVLITAGPFMPAYVTLDSNPLKSIADMATKKVNFNQGPKGYLTPMIVQEYFKEYGITYDKIKQNGGTINYLGFTDAFQQLQDGRIDVCYTLGLGPFPPLKNVDVMKPVRFLTSDPEKLKKFAEMTPGVRAAKVPKGDYYKVASKMDIDTIILDYIYIVNADLPEDLVYKITKLSVEKLWDWHLQYRNEYERKYNGADQSLLGATIPVHPGAMKYYREAGIKFPPGYSEAGLSE